MPNVEERVYPPTSGGELSSGYLCTTDAKHKFCANSCMNPSRAKAPNRNSNRTVHPRGSTRRVGGLRMPSGSTPSRSLLALNSQADRSVLRSGLMSLVERPPLADSGFGVIMPRCWLTDLPEDMPRIKRFGPQAETAPAPPTHLSFWPNRSTESSARRRVSASVSVTSKLHSSLGPCSGDRDCQEWRRRMQRP